MPLTIGMQNPSSTDKGWNPLPGIRPTMPAFVKGLITKMIIRLCKAWRVIRRSFFPFVREARRSFPKKRTPDRSYQYAKYRTGRCDVSSKFSCKNLSGVSCVWANQSHCKINKNALSSVSLACLEMSFNVKGPGAVILLFVWNTKRVLYVIM